MKNVIPAKAGIHNHRLWNMDSRFRGNDMQKMLYLVMLMSFFYFLNIQVQAETQAIPLKQQYAQELKAVNVYLNNIKTLKAKFSQTSASSPALTLGRVYIEKPGKARWEYFTPAPALLIINGKDMVFYDQEVEQVTYTDVPDNPLTILLEETIDIAGKDAEILNVIKTQDTLTVIAEDKAHKAARLSGGALAMTFDLQPLALSRVQVTDENNHTTTVILERLETNLALDENLFIFKDPRPLKERKNLPQ